MRPRVVSRAVTWGLLASWTVHDIEEALAVGPFAESFQRRFGCPLPVSPVQLRVAIGYMGLMVGAASLRGEVTDGRSRLFRLALVGHGAHSIGHVAGSIAYRGYTPGVVTAATVVAPHGWWAWRTLRSSTPAEAGGPPVAASLAAAVTALALSHTLAAGTLAVARKRRRPDPSALAPATN